MFDLRYHVASLAAVFVALVLGIFVGRRALGEGVRLATRSGRTSRRRSTRCAASGTARSHRAASADRRGVDARRRSRRRRTRSSSRGMLDGKSVGVVFVGSVDQGARRTPSGGRSATPAGGVALVRALRVPLDPEAVDAALRARAGHARARRDRQPRAARARAGARARHRGAQPRVRPPRAGDRRGAVGRGRPRARRGRRRASGAAAAGRDAGRSSRASTAGSPRRRCRPSGSRRATPRSARSRCSSAAASRPSTAVDDAAGQVALVFLLAGARPGSYGVGNDAVDGILPDPPPAPPPRARGDASRADGARRGAGRGGADRRGRSRRCARRSRRRRSSSRTTARATGRRRVAADAGARVVSLPRRGKGQALTLAERECREGPLLLCDADLVGDLRPLVEADADLAVARFARRAGGGLGLAKGVARA